jgi:hypothetical protein
MKFDFNVTWYFCAGFEVLTALTLKSGPLSAGYFGIGLLFACYSLGLFFGPEDGSRMFLQNIGKLEMS